jgi:hypothetical protein
MYVIVMPAHAILIVLARIPTPVHAERRRRSRPGCPCSGCRLPTAFDGGSTGPPSGEVTLRKRTSGPGLQVPFEAERRGFRSELDGDDYAPRPVSGCVSVLSGVVAVGPAPEVGGQADVVALRIANASEDVDCPFDGLVHALLDAGTAPRSEHETSGQSRRSPGYERQDSRET